MSRCHLIGSLGDALHAMACAAGPSTDGIRWLMRAMLRLGLKGLFAPSNLWLWATLTVRWSAIGEIARRLITAKASPVRRRHFPFVAAIAFSILQGRLANQYLLAHTIDANYGLI